MPTKQETHEHNNVALWIIIAFLAGAAFMSLLFLVHGKGLKSQAYSVYGGDFQEFGSLNHNCFDASLDGPAVQRCLGIPGPVQSDTAPYRAAPAD